MRPDDIEYDPWRDILAVRRFRRRGLTYQQIAWKLNSTKGRVAGIVRRYINHSEPFREPRSPQVRKPK